MADRSADALFAGGGEVGEVMASWDWAATPVGPPQMWPAPLRQVVRILLTSRFSMWMAWGPELAFFYNDAYRRDTLRAKHPWALGRPARQVWAEVWEEAGPRIQSVLDTGEATWDESLRLFLERAGYVEETFHTFSYSPLHGEDGRVAGMLCVVSEDTERVLGERRLRVLSDLGEISAVTAPTVERACTAALQVLQRARPDVPFASIYLLEADGGAADRVGFYGMVDDPAIVPQRLDRQTHPKAPLWALLQAGQPQVLDGLDKIFPRMLLPLDGMPQRDPERVVAVPLTGGGGRPVGVLFAGVSPFRALDEKYRRFVDLVAVGVSTVIADARSLQDQLRRADELAELDRAKTEFFTSMSHELRTPLTLISGPAEDGLADTADPLSAGQRARMEVIARSTGRLRRLVDTLLEFSRLEAGRLVPNRAAVDLAALTRGIAGSFAPAVRRAGLEFVLDCPPLPSAVAVDVDMWEKIVLNLLSNAVKYTLAGTVWLRLRMRVDGGVELAVTDTGIGIPAADRPLLFQRFRRVRGATGRSIEGSGIGLALVAELTALHGGAVGVDSTPEQGSTFTVTLPPTVLTEAAPVPAHVSPVVELYREEALHWSGTAGEPAVSSDHAPPAAAVAFESTADATVLVIEDNADLRGFLSELLSRHYTVLQAADGRAGLEQARAEHPDLVLTDVMMPGLDGFALLAQLRADPGTATTAVILLSARTGAEAVAEGLAAGADDYLVKPFSSHDLLARVRSNLELARLRNREGAWRGALLNALLDAFFVIDPAGCVVEVNDAFGEILGYGAEGLPYPAPHPWWPDPDTDPDAHAQLLRDQETAFASGGRFVLPLQHRDGSRVWAEVSASALPDPDGDGRMIVGVLRDVTERHRGAQHDRLLADTGELLARPGGLRERLARFTELAAPVLADLVTVSLIGPDGRLAPTAAAHHSFPDVAAAWLRLPSYAIPSEVRGDFQAGRAFLIGDITTDLLIEAFADETARAASRGLRLRSSLAVPLVVDGRLLGALSFVSTPAPRTHDAVDMALAEELGRRVAGMVAADRVAVRERHLHTVSTALAGAATVDEATNALLENLVAILGIECGAVYIVRPDDPAHLHLTHHVGMPPGIPETFAVMLISARVPSAVAARTRTALWLSDQQAWVSRHPDLVEAMARGGSSPDVLGRAVAALPLLVQGRVVGAVAVSFATERAFPDDERAFVLTIVAQAAQAIDRTISADARREIADTLQHGLLPARLPVVRRLALAARYLPAGRHNAAGGDWYDVTVLDDDHVAITVGDVVGHGAPAAAVMGQLRSALAAYLLESNSPSHAVSWLSRFATDIDGARASTAICLVLHTGTGTLRWARAGHPPPLVLDATDGPRFLDDAHGPVLGLTRALPISEGHAQLTPGSTVVLYTDGLIERRNELIDDGFDRLAAACRHELVPDRLIPVLLEHTLGGNHPSDDVALVAARLLPGPLAQRLPARPDRLPALRGTVAGWAAAAGLPEQHTDDLQLAVGEAAANAIEHAYHSGEPGEFSYRLDLERSGDVQVEVADEGTWRRPSSDPGYRGRGLLLIRELATDLTVDHDDAHVGTLVRFTIPTSVGNTYPPPRPLVPATTRNVNQPASLRTDRRGDRRHLVLSGDVDLITIGPLRAELLEELRSATGPITLDTRNVTYLSSAGVGLLLEALDALPGRLELLTEPDSPAGRILALTGLDRAKPDPTAS